MLKIDELSLGHQEKMDGAAIAGVAHEGKKLICYLMLSSVIT